MLLRPMLFSTRHVSFPCSPPSEGTHPQQFQYVFNGNNFETLSNLGRFATLWPPNAKLKTKLEATTADEYSNTALTTDDSHDLSIDEGDPGNEDNDDHNFSLIMFTMNLLMSHLTLIQAYFPLKKVRELLKKMREEVDMEKMRVLIKLEQMREPGLTQIKEPWRVYSWNQMCPMEYTGRVIMAVWSLQEDEVQSIWNCYRI